MKHTGNSRPLAPCSVVSTTLSPLSSCFSSPPVSSDNIRKNSGTIGHYAGGAGNDTVTNSQKVGKKTLKGTISGDVGVGTGSNSVVVKDLFVPEHRFLSIPAAIEGKNLGANLHPTTLYHSAAVPALALFIATPALGMARRALEHFKERLPGRTVSYTFNEKQIEMATTHMEIAEAATKLDAARTLLHATVDEVE